MDLDIGTYLLFGVLMLIPAVVVFLIANAIRLRKSKFHRQRITKNGSKSSK